jgi:aspartyl-tRNA(Asn)/glutamyl-tRNA(Gln) amidotransferase subunit B
MRYLGTCDGNMQNGNLRADVNVSSASPAPTRNIARPGFLPSRHALRDQEHELHALHPAGHRVRGAPPDRHPRGGGERSMQETRLYDPDKGETRSMRSKEEAHDYRYFPDPDLLPLEIEQAWVDDIAAPARTARRQEGALHQATTASPTTTPAC